MPSDDSGSLFDLLGIAAVLFLVVANGFFVASEFSLVAVRRSRVAELVAAKRANAASRRQSRCLSGGDAARYYDLITGPGLGRRTRNCPPDRAAYRGGGRRLIEREDGSLLIGGMMSAHDAFERLELGSPEGDFHTIAGFVLSQVKHLPQAGEHFTYGGWRFEIVDMDGRRIDKIMVRREPTT